ncbi:hypothetical protein HG536_0B03560 [Torulaspora globosa]|uniref:Cell wall mannoprotein PIR1-like C-terminal domain-containing protein n=1 Tax=Torulaspora globosa TaxID=48254 RepID=A0A7G3ZDA7_9SACH|nr:uncharacterized protein HG536_0B03560 [Torulaspora globosa]QLL31493.1 hypothetical protein HG536_0B03560 [Torulaspora globosa]
MQLKNVALVSAACLASNVCADGYTPGQEWSTLTPTATYKCGITEYASSFGLAVQTISSSMAKRDAVSQIGDGQLQATTTGVSQIGDGQLQATTTAAPQATGSQSQQSLSEATTTLSPSSAAASNSACATQPVTLDSSSCKNSGTLTVQLKGGVLTDGKGRIGSIVANRQFQFDGPPPQAGAIYAAGWSITPGGNLALGENDVFYQCLSGNFYNLYDQSIGEQCHPIHLELVNLVDC